MRLRSQRGRRAAGCLLLAMLFAALLPMRGAGAQTLARPRWAGSGMKVERWWQNAVLYEVRPEDGEAKPGRSPLEELTARLDSLEALGVDAVLLREVDAADGRSRGTGVSDGAANSAAPLSARYGSLEQFDRLLSEASRRRLRVLVELPGSLRDDALVSQARFWLSRGATGLYLSSGEAAPGVGGSGAPAALPVADRRQQVRALRSVLRGFVGERVLLGDAAAFVGGGGAAADAPDLLLTPLRGLGDGGSAAGPDLPALRGSLAALARAGGTSVSEIARPKPVSGMEEARAEVTVLLSARGGVALGAEALTASAGSTASGAVPDSSPAGALAGGAGGSAADPLFAWTSRMVGLHRGNATMRDGVQTVLDRDADGALVVVWRGGGARPQVLVEIVNLADKPLQMSLVEDAARLRLRGSFLRTVLRSDAGMGAMPLRAVRLPAYGVYLGELGR